MKRWTLAPIVGALLLLGSETASAQAVIQCESRDYQYQFCGTPDGVTRARLVEQRSRSACVEGRSWGYDRRGVWVSNGCEGLFEYQSFRPEPPVVRPGGNVITCESRNYQQDFCNTDFNIVSANLVRQKSRTPCVEGRNWGWRSNGIWVSGGCEGDFEVRTASRPGQVPSGAGHVVCESREYQYNLCPTGRVRDAQLVRQISQAPCIQGQTWGVTREGIWVDRGCEAEFRIVGR
ncbi:MAG TPA: DUF3011 domain-containing protein [Casimicrobiaceae bacterium]|nr:DUF3011 domain-containing protein [Casimicrobiaceae bacterium]